MSNAQSVLQRARGELGYTETPAGSNQTKYGQWYGLDRQPWCAMFVSWCFYHEGLPLRASSSKGFAYTPAGAAWFKQQQRWRGHRDAIEAGAVVFFYWKSLNRIGHVGIVDAVNPDGTFWSIEGNTDVRGGRTGGKVIRQLRSRATVGAGGGFGLPHYGTTRPHDAPRLAQPTQVSTYREEDVRTTFLSVGPLGTGATDKGKGWVAWDPGLGRDPVVVGVAKHGPYPPVDGFWDEQAGAIVSAQARDGKVIVTVHNGPPGGAVNVFVSVS